MGVCSKTLDAGDVAWKCLDCEKDPTSIICAQCFEKSDHQGHRVELKRNVGGCCDCGDPEAWDKRGFCPDHRGQHAVDPQKVIDKLPEGFRNTAKSVFKSVIQQLKKKCINLLNYDTNYLETTMTEADFLKTMVESIRLIFEFLNAKINECPAYIHIIDLYINAVTIERKKVHEKCCPRLFLDQDSEQRKDFEMALAKHLDKNNMCSCTAVDLCFQSNFLLDNQTRVHVYDFFFKMFQSYHSKQCLAISYAANYPRIQTRNRSTQGDLQMIGVQVLTSDDLSMLIFKRPELRELMLNTLEKQLQNLSEDPTDPLHAVRLSHVLHDLRYMARPECLKYCISQTDWIEQLILIFEKFYFIDIKRQKTQMVQYDQEGKPNWSLFNVEDYVVKLLIIYLKEVNVLDLNKNKAIFKAFHAAFTIIYVRHIQLAQETNETQTVNHREYKGGAFGMYNMPLHRVFTYYITRFLLLNQFDKNSQFFGCQNSQILKAIATNQGQLHFQESQENEQIQKLLKCIVGCLTKKVSFVHEIQAGKWIYYGFYMQQYPLIYYNVQERGSVQDLALMQIILTCDATLVDYVIDNFGLDTQLQTLINCLKTKKIAQIKFSQFQMFDPSKMRLELLSFLRFFVQISINEVGYLKQIFNRKFDTDSEKNSNTFEIEQMWTKAVKREAIHLLLLTKVNTSIREIKDKVSEMFKTDLTFEKMLFEVSEQQRDIKNQVTFRLKDSNYKIFDPYLYSIPDQQSQIYQMYEQNSLKDKYVEEGVNDIVGDYLDNYSYASNVNGQIQQNIANSQMLLIICPLLVNWLKFKDQQEQDFKDQGQLSIQQFVSRVNLLSNSLRPGSIMTTFKHLNLPTRDYFTSTSLLTVNDETFLHQIVDANVGYSCLKLLVIILKSVNKLMPADKKSWHAAQFTTNDNELVRLIINFTNEANIDVKMKKLLEYILDHINQLDKSAFDFIKLNQGKSEVKRNEEETKQTEKQSVDKTKRKKNKLMSKMKKGAAKYLNTNQKEEDSKKKDVEAKDESEMMECAFCTKEMDKSNFSESPFGNFGYVQCTKVYFHACAQTIKSQKAALKNSKLSTQFEEEEKQTEQLPNQEATQIPQGSKQFKLEKLELVNQLCGDDKGFLNHYTGAGCVVNNCKHYAHVSCLRDYLQQQLSSAESLENLARSGFSQGEFACPLCKGISNTLIPTYSIQDIYPNQLQLAQTLDPNTKSVLDFYVDHFSEIIIKQQGFLCIEARGVEKVRLLERHIVLKDIKSDPQRFLQGISQYMTHIVNLIDVKGMPSFPSNQLRKMHISIQQVVQMVLVAKHDVLDSIQPNKSNLDEIVLEMIKKLSNGSKNQFLYDSNIVGNFVIEFLVLFGLLSWDTQKKQEMLNCVLQRICKIVRIQVLIAAVFRIKYGQLQNTAEDISQNLSLSNLAEIETKSKTQADLQDMIADIELPAMRKIYAASCIINDQLDMNTVLKSQSNQEELKIIKQSLGLKDQDLYLLAQNQKVSISEDLQQIIPHILNQVEDSQVLEGLLSNLSQLDSKKSLNMPTNLLLMVPSFELSFFDLPKSYTDLQKEFYKRPCFYCQKEVWDSATCLLTGRTMCWFNQEIEQCKIGAPGQQNIQEGLLSWYSRVSEGGCGVFLHTSTGYIVIIQNGSCTLVDSPYRNKYGEIVNYRDKRYEDYNIDTYCLNQLRNKYLSFQIANEILQSRTNPDSKLRLFRNNAM